MTMYAVYMAYTSQDVKTIRTYVTAVNASKKRAAKCVTVYGLTPKQVITLIRDAINAHQRKAG